MLKVITVVGTRPEIIRLSETIKLLDSVCDHILVHTGQNYDYELNQIFFDDLDIREPDYFLNAAEDNLAATLANIFRSLDEILEKINPDAFLVLGDTNSALSAILAKRRKVPVFHVEAGNRCFDYNVPEEINRKIVDNVADINITYSQLARENLIREGFQAQQVICLGSPMKEVITKNQLKIEQSSIISKLGIEKKNYFLFSLHREENVDEKTRVDKAVEIIRYIASEYNLPTILSLHPRTRKRLPTDTFIGLENLIIHPPFCFSDYLSLQANAKIVFSDSGTITEECSIMNFPAINLRDTHERPEGMEVGAAMFTGLELESIKNAVALLLHVNQRNQIPAMVEDYDVNDFSLRLVKAILSYSQYVNTYIWHKG